MCQEVMVQGLAARIPVVAGVWFEAKAKVEVEWVNHLQQYQAEVVSVQTVEKRSLTLLGSLVMQKAVQNVVRK